MDKNESLTVTLTLENDEDIECEVLTLFEADARQYIALIPLCEKDRAEDGDVFLYRFSEDENGEPILGNIEDDDEYECAADKFDEWLDTMEFEDPQTDFQDE